MRTSYTTRGGRNYILRLEIRDYDGPIKDYSNPFPFGKSDSLSDQEHIKTKLRPTYWYDSLFIYIVILDLLGIIFFVLPYWKTFITLRTNDEINVALPNHLQKKLKQKLKYVVLTWDSMERTIWMRPKGMNLLYIPFMVTKWPLNHEQTQIVKQEVKQSSGSLVALLAIGFLMFSLFNREPEGVSNFPVNLKLVMTVLLIIMAIMNGWRLSRRMLSLSQRTIDSSFE